MVSRQSAVDAASLTALRALFTETDVGLLVEDADRRVDVTNAAFLRLFGVPANPEQMIGADCAAAAQSMAPMFSDPQAWLRGIEQLVTGTRSEHGRILELVDGRFLERDYVPVLTDGQSAGHMWMYRDVTVRERAARELEQGRRDLDRSNALLRSTNDLLQTVARVQSMLLTTGDEQSVFDELLSAALALTGSEFGFFGEVEHHPDTGAPVLLAHAYTDIAWDEATRDLMAEVKVTGFRFTNMDTLFGAAMLSGEVVVSNDPTTDPRAGGTPPGHPPLRAFLGLPVMAGDELLGLVGLANRPDGYDEALVRWLQPFLSTCASVLLHARADRARRRGEDEVRAARARAERASAAKNAFLSRMSHELRTPLNAMLGFAQLLELRAASDVDRGDAGRIVGAGRHLLALLDDVMDMASIEDGRVSLDMARIDLPRLLAECVRLIEPAAKERGIRVTLAAGTPVEAVRADAARLRQVLLNLLDNAVKYGHHGGGVDVVATVAADGMACIDVCDDGPGIPTDDADRIFEPFERIEAEAMGVVGTGLGLPVSRSLARAMGGDLVLVPGRPGRTVLRVTVPLAGPEDEPPLRRPAGDDVDEVSGRVVYVEDNATNAVLVRSVLGHLLPEVELVVAPTGGQALQLLAEKPPDLLLLDLHLPDMDGLDVLARSGVGGTLPVYVITADATPETRRRVLTEAIDGILVKPVNPRDLADAVRDALRRAGR